MTGDATASPPHFDDAQTRFIPQGRFAFKGDAGEA
jgi:hypothetical protein